MRSGALAFAFAVFAVLAVVEPLAAYSAALAAFGLPHVISELRFVDKRFGRRIAREQITVILALLAGVVVLRTATVFQLLPSQIGVPAELAGVAALALACAQGSFARRALALAVGLVLGIAALATPFATATVLAVLHNLTPLGFLWQIAPGDRRPRWMGAASAVLLGLPLLVATGLPRLALAALGLPGTGADPVGAGLLANNLGAYVPAFLGHSVHAVDLFTASVVAQGGHYLAVIVVLPTLLRRLDPDAQGLVGWPRPGLFAAALALSGAVSLAVFLQGFAEARLLYGIAAAFHAWIEIPILVLALTGGAQRPSSSPASNDAELARTEISVA